MRAGSAVALSLAPLEGFCGSLGDTAGRGRVSDTFSARITSAVVYLIGDVSEWFFFFETTNKVRGGYRTIHR